MGSTYEPRTVGELSIRMLKYIEQEIPADGRASHCITLTERGTPKVNVIYRDGWYSFELNAEDLQRKEADLAEDVVQSVRAQQQSDSE